MKRLREIPGKILLVLILTGFAIQLSAQELENDFQSRTSVKLSYKPLKKVKLNFTPELRFNDNLKFDQYLFEGEIIYKPIKLISVGTSYRFTGNKTGSGDYENRNKYALFIEAEKKLKRFTPSLKMSYTNFAGDDDENSHFLRYKASVDYNICKSKFTPEISVEAFHNLSENELYKMRYSAGLNYKLFKNNSIVIDYKLDYYMQEYRNKHIVSIGYKIKF
ncbi:MAG: DUF2490 domain-containing protein [Prolixibacteraceae bacterium]|jgi:hypothetical protein|nr:DUF2490 domain-containing protein [Prolixibacteraceae bacterium]